MSETSEIHSWWGNCRNDQCAVTVTVATHPESPAGGIPDPDAGDWDQWMTTCPVCGDGFDWGGGDPFAAWELP